MSYDNAVTEQFYNTLKDECINQCVFEKEVLLQTTMHQFSYEWDNNERSHTYNNCTSQAK